MNEKDLSYLVELLNRYDEIQNSIEQLNKMDNVQKRVELKEKKLLECCDLLGKIYAEQSKIRRRNK